MDTAKCLLCRKHQGLELRPPGGYIFENNVWLVCHAPIDKGPLGTLFIESRRHFLDYGDFNDTEMATFAPLLSQIYTALRAELRPERIYLITLMEGIPHFHAWIVPRMAEDAERGVAFLAIDLKCQNAEAEKLAGALRSHITAK
jgi:diadenosine tetraphosphate (Ap4A) HIT family hydrolase